MFLLEVINVDINASIIELNLSKDISIADVYVLYYFLHPEKLKIKKGRLIGGELSGNSRFIKGNNHEAIIDLDYNHFQELLKKIYIKLQ